MRRLRIWGLLLLALLALAAGVWVWQRVEMPLPTSTRTELRPGGVQLARSGTADPVAPSARPEPANAKPASAVQAPALRSNTEPAFASDISNAARVYRGSDPAQAATIAELERRSRAGDRDAVRQLAEALRECSAALAAMKPMPPEQIGAFGPNPYYTEMHSRRLAFLGPRAQECRAVFNDPDAEINQRNLEEAMRLAYTDALAVGDFMARMWAVLDEGQTYPPPASVLAQLRALSLANLDARNPQSLLDLAPFSNLISPIDTEHAWRLAACDLGYDCAANGRLARRLCVDSGTCFGGSYEEFLLSRLSPRQWEIVQAQRARLLHQLRNGNLSGVIQGPPNGG